MSRGFQNAKIPRLVKVMQYFVTVLAKKQQQTNCVLLIYLHTSQGIIMSEWLTHLLCVQQVPG
jgi:hypothetical protein